MGAPIALPIRPPDGDLVDLSVAPLLAFERAVAARDCLASREEDRDGLEVTAAAGGASSKRAESRGRAGP
eukprot:3425794-Prymnesium_polylepis.1